MDNDVKIVNTGCSHKCGGRCLLRAHVRDGVIVRLSSDDTPPGTPGRPALRACARGRAYRQRIYAPDRLQVPLRRAGERGDGRFEPIGWDDALEIVANELARVKQEYGPAAILNLSRGSGRVLHTDAVISRLLNLLGGQTQLWGSLSNQAEIVASAITLGTSGTMGTGRERHDFLNSRLVIMWGWNPADTIFGNDTTWWLQEAKRRGTKLICIDPRFTASAAMSHEHVPIRPSTDPAMMLAMAYVLIEEGLCDRRFLDRFTVGFDEAHLPPGSEGESSFESYVLGRSDGQPKTPAWAAPITGVPAETIVRLARDYGLSKPAALHAGFAPGQTANGESFHRLAMTLAAMTGNIGIAGGNAGTTATASRPVSAGFPAGTNPAGAAVNSNQWADAVLLGKDGGFPSDIRMVYSANSNVLNQVGNVNKSVRALRKVEFVVIHEQFMTPMARFADILLPATTTFERNDFTLSWYQNGCYGVFLNKVIEPIGQCRDELDVCGELAARLGLSGYNPKREEQWLREFASAAGITDFDGFRETAVCWLPEPVPPFAFQRQIEDPAAHPFATPSGKIEILSTALATKPDQYGLGKLPTIPMFEMGWEGPGHALAVAYPLQLITPCTKRRAHSEFDNLPWLRKIDPQVVWLNPRDAEARSVEDGDIVEAFNERGRVRLAAKVTARIMPGVVSINQGAWHDPDNHGVDAGGCANVLCAEGPTPGGSNVCHTALVQVERVGRKQ